MMRMYNTNQSGRPFFLTLLVVEHLAWLQVLLLGSGAAGSTSSSHGEEEVGQVGSFSCVSQICTESSLCVVMVDASTCPSETHSEQKQDEETSQLKQWEAANVK